MLRHSHNHYSNTTHDPHTTILDTHATCRTCIRTHPHSKANTCCWYLYPPACPLRYRYALWMHNPKTAVVPTSKFEHQPSSRHYNMPQCLNTLNPCGCFILHFQKTRTIRQPLLSQPNRALQHWILFSHCQLHAELLGRSHSHAHSHLHLAYERGTLLYLARPTPDVLRDETAMPAFATRSCTLARHRRYLATHFLVLSPTV